MKLNDLAKTLRSKNAGPFLTTMDVFFANAESYRRVKDSGAITPESIAALYDLNPQEVYGVYFLDDALGFKVTIYKRVPSCDPASTDVMGAHQHILLSQIEIP